MATDPVLLQRLREEAAKKYVCKVDPFFFLVFSENIALPELFGTPNPLLQQIVQIFSVVKYWGDRELRAIGKG